MFEDFVGKRYLMAKRDRNMLSVITLISVGGVAVGVMALIVVLSFMGGFEADFREKIIGSKSHVVISAVDGYLEDYGELRDIARSVDRVEGVNVFVEAEVMLNSPTNLQASILRGIDYREITTTTKMEEYMKEGKLEFLENPDALPDILSAGSNYRSGSINIQQDPEDGELKAEELGEKIDAATRGAISNAGLYHGKWLGSGTDEAIPDLEHDTPSTNRDSVNDEAITEEEFKEEAITEEEFKEDVIDPEDADLIALIGEDRWVDDAPEAVVHRSPIDAWGEDPNIREPNAKLYPQKTRSRQMKALPGLTEADASKRRVGAIILGNELKQNLSIYLGGELNVMSPSGDLGPSGGMPKSRPFKLVGSYHSGMLEFDAKMGYISLKDAQDLLGIGDRISGIDIKCTRIEDSILVRDNLREKLANYPNVRVDDWRTLNSSLFGAIMLEKVAMFTILTSIILVASFSILCLLIMMVIEKAREIAILKAMGAKDSSIVALFVYQGAFIGILGTVIGLVLGLLLCWVITFLKLKIPGNAHYIDHIPVTIEPAAIVLICVASIAISLLATVLPSLMAARLKTVDGLRCE